VSGWRHLAVAPLAFPSAFRCVVARL
jgi:hypothetical protein